MSRKTLEDRVEMLEKKMTPLEQLPARMTALEGQISQLRGEMRGEFLAVRSEMKTQGAEIRTELRAEIKAQGKVLLTAINDGDEKTRAEMRMLYENLRSDIRLLGESGSKRSKRR